MSKIYNLIILFLILNELPKGYEDTILSKWSGMQLLNLNSTGKGKTVLYLHGGSYLHDLDPDHFKFLKKLI